MRRAPLFTALLAASGCESTTNLLKIPAALAWVAVQCCAQGACRVGVHVSWRTHWFRAR